MKSLVIGLLLLACNAGWADSIMAQDQLEPGREDKCPVCGMFVYKYPEWVAAIVYQDDTIVYFDGAKDMFKYYHNLSHYAPDRKIEDVRSVWVKDYYELEMIDAKKAVFVIGSQVYGPMGKELVPLITEEDARTFIEDHQGKTLVYFDEVTPDLLKGLD